MKTLFAFLITLLTCNTIFCQEINLYSPTIPGQNIITDAIEINGFYYLLQVDIGNQYASSLIIINSENGAVVDSQSLSPLSFLSAQFISFNGDSIFLLGRLKTDSCQSVVITAYYSLLNKTLNIISEIPFCKSTVQNLRIQNALENEYLINGYWVNNGYRRFILKMDQHYNLTLILDSIISKYATIDFSRKGYLIKDESFCSFYDKDFNFLKDRYSLVEGINNLHQTHEPFGDHYLLESFSGSPGFENKGHHVRLVDSNLHVVKQLYIMPGTEDFSGGVDPPFYGGINFIDNNTFWMSGNFNITNNLELPTHFSVTKVNENLEILCNQYVGFDRHYRIYGLQNTSDGGVLVFGMTYNSTQDPYLIKLGPNCELPTTSVSNTAHPLVSITVYPNPAFNSITFDVQGFDPTSLSLEIFNSAGVTLFSRKDLSYDIIVTDFPPGQYFYKIILDDKILGTGGWVKQ